MAIPPARFVGTSDLVSARASGGVPRRGRAGRRTVCSDPSEHERKVARVVHDLRARRSIRPLVLQKRAASHMVTRPHDRRRTDDKLDIRDLNSILAIDPAARTCVAEPGVTFVDLVAATLPYGLAPAVVPELETITIGGAVAGGSIESTSFRHGGFHDTCLAYEVVTATGEVLTCTPEHDPLTFQMMHGTFGTLGVLTKLTFQLIPARPWVHVVRQRFDQLDAFLAAMRAHQRADDVDFMDGMIYAPDELVLTVGRFVDEAPAGHGERPRAARDADEAYLATEAYYFRDRGVGRANRMFDVNALGRIGQWFQRLVHADHPDLTLDVLVPLSRAPTFLAWYQRTIGHYPVGCMPYRPGHRYEWLAPAVFAGVTDDLYVDLAVAGAPQPAGRNYYRELERALAGFGGVKTLRSHNYYDEHEFWRTWNRPNYARVKRRTDPQNVLRDLYDKTCRASHGRA
ncbi:MAG: FAD-binding oxidoreductase [Myxococcales bacterium]|nr:FAD-binding oxidoreductase [Myxococcales bacterium]MBK7192076.1 FAD-binding oxidoreductase [Myxococcales bacterium]MBP6845637.1 FAD-binding oxidoreductase [Kofleriaceae bacterium]